MLQYTVVLTQNPEDGRWIVDVPALPGCHTHGDTRQHALDMARDAIGLFVDQLTVDGTPLPADVAVNTTLVAISDPAVAASA
jgi:predicted RNase H-like HicB family nuclease